jgi:hypothetical protein
MSRPPKPVRYVKKPMRTEVERSGRRSGELQTDPHR